MVVAGCLFAARRGVAGGRGGCPRPLGGFAGDEASTACVRRRLARRYGVRCRLLANGSSRVSRRRATRHSVKMGAVRSVRDGWARGAARSGPLMERKLRALREALSAIPARAGRSRAPIGAARTGRSNRRKPVVGAAADNLQTRQPRQARIALQT